MSFYRLDIFFVVVVKILVVDCGDPGQLTNGLRKDKNMTTYNSMVHYFCNPEYILSGSRERVCQADGKWSGTQPKCTSKNFALHFSFYF